jgi:hypothetical protein
MRYIAIIILGIVSAAVVGYVTLTEPPAVEESLGANLTSIAKLTAATTSPVLLAPNATYRGWVPSATLTMKSGNVDDARLNIHYRASTTGSVLLWNYFYSNNGVDWYGEDYSTTASYTTTHSTTTIVHRFAPASTSVRLKSVPLPAVTTPYFKVVFDGLTASGSLYAEITKQEN